MNRVVSRIVAVGLVVPGLLLPVVAEGKKAAADPHVVASRIEEGSGSASRLVAVEVREKGKGSVVELKLDGTPGTYEVIELRRPSRLAIDLWGVERSSAQPAGASAEVSQVRLGSHGDKVRVVVDLAKKLGPYRIERDARALVVHLGDTKGAPALAESKAAEPEAQPAAPSQAPNAAAVAQAPATQVAAASADKPAPAKAASARLVDVNFEQQGEIQEVRLSLSRKVPYRVERPDPRTVVLSLDDTDLPQALVRSLDASAYNGPVRTISSYRDTRDGKVRVVVALAEPTEDRVHQSDGELRWRFRPAAQATIIDETGAVTRIAPETSQARQGRRPRYTGQRISFEFKDIDIHNLLRVIAEVSGKNLIVTDDVKGFVTIRLRNVPWDQALDLILKVKGLGMEETGNVIRIAPMHMLQREREAAARADEAKMRAEPLLVRIIPVNYALASELQAKVRPMMTNRGSLTVDERTNTLILRDVQEVIERSEQLVRTLDTQTPQVLISARIVEVSSNFSRDLGVQWGGSFSATQATGNATGLAFPNSAVASGGLAENLGAGGAVPATPNWAVSFPAGVSASAGSAVGFTFGSAGGAAQLNLRLSALETKGMLKTVSAPRVTTLDNREAVIGQGVSIPFSQVSAAGVNTVFIDAKLELRVTPHVTQDGSVLMRIHATNNQPADNVRGANGQPGLIKREANTEVLVRDGDTTVIGGIFVRKTTEAEAQVPLLGDIPIIGWLFKSRTAGDERTELMIFISPTIVNREASLVAGG